VEGVQPSIPQNPNTNTADLLPKGPNANPHLAAANGLDNVNVKPLVKHVLSKESQELFNKLSGALVDETNIEWQNAALAAISTEPGIHQLTTYILSFIAEKVTHNMKNLFILSQMMRASEALLNNQAIYLDPYIAYMVPPILTCCIGGKLGPTNQPAPSNASTETLGGAVPDYSRAASDAFYLRTFAAHLLRNICRKYSSSNQGLKSRIARTCLKQFMDPDKSVGTHFGALQALLLVLGPADALRGLILPNMKMYSEDFLAKKLADESTRHDAEILLDVLVGSFPALVPKGVRERAEKAKTEGSYQAPNLDEVRERLVDKVGDLVAGRLISKKMDLEIQEILSKDFDI
jgi:transcription initiation factor TFIID subunit 6